jgi:hypothetical protein
VRRGSAKGTGTLFLFLLSGVIFGGIIGRLLGQYLPYAIFTDSITIGFGEGAAAVIHLVILSVTFGFTIIINFGTVLGLLLGILLYMRS